MMIALRTTLAATALALLSACGASNGATGMTSYVTQPQTYSPMTYSDGVNRTAPTTYVATSGQPIAPARVGVTLTNPYSGRSVFTTDRQLTQDERMRMAAEICRAHGQVLVSADIAELSAYGTPGARTQPICQ